MFSKSASFLAGSLIVLLAASCGKTPRQDDQAASSGPMPVMVASPIIQKISEWDEFSARVEAVDSVEIRPRITGYLSKVNFTAGQMVKKGDVLFEIDPNYEEAALATAAAAVAQAEAALKTAQSEAGRVPDLLKARAISNEEADKRMNALASAQASLQAAVAAKEKAMLDLEYTKVRTPIDGRVSLALVTPGNYVSGVAGFTTLLTTVVSMDPVYVYASVDDATFLRYNKLIREKKLGNPETGKVPAELQIEGDEGFPHKGYVEFFDNRINPGTGSITVRAVFPNPDGALIPGSFARLRIPGSQEYEATLVDEKYIGTDQSVKFVMVVGGDGTAEMRPVKLGRQHNGLRIIREGLNPGDKLIVSGLQMLRPGAPVAPLPPQPAPETSTASR